MPLTDEQKAAMLARLKGASNAPTPVLTPSTEVTIKPPVVQAPINNAATEVTFKEILDTPTANKRNTGSAVGTTGNSINVLEVKSKIAELQTALLTAHPQMPVLLRTIHTQLRKDEELVTLLDEEEIGIIVNGLKRQTQTELLIADDKVSKSKTNAMKAKVANIGLDDL